MKSPSSHAQILKGSKNLCIRLLAYKSRVSAILACLLVLSGSAFAQFDGGEVVGTIKDSSGAAIPQASVTLTNINQGTADHRTTDGNWNFDFPSAQIGEYSVMAEKQGPSLSRSAPFAVQIAARQRADPLLKIGQANETATVSGAATMLVADTSDHGEVIDHREAANMPLNGHVNGQRSTANNFLLDGLANNYYSTENQGVVNRSGDLRNPCGGS